MAVLPLLGSWEDVANAFLLVRRAQAVLLSSDPAWGRSFSRIPVERARVSCASSYPAQIQTAAI